MRLSAIWGHGCANCRPWNPTPASGTVCVTGWCPHSVPGTLLHLCLGKGLAAEFSVA